MVYSRIEDIPYIAITNTNNLDQNDFVVHPKLLKVR